MSERAASSAGSQPDRDPKGRLHARGWSGTEAPAFEAAVRGSRGWGLTWADGAVIAVTLLVAAAVAVALWLGRPAVPDIPAVPGALGASGPVAVVQSKDGFYEVLPLDRDQTVTVEGPLGTNVIEVRDGAVRCAESDCGNQVCVRTGWATGVGQMIVCLPHQLTVEVVSDPADATPLV